MTSHHSSTENSSYLSDIVEFANRQEYLNSLESLPTLPLPTSYLIHEDRFEIDGNVFLFKDVDRRFLDWIRESLNRWRAEAHTSETDAWLKGMMDAFTESLIQWVDTRDSH